MFAAEDGFRMKSRLLRDIHEFDTQWGSQDRRCQTLGGGTRRRFIGLARTARGFLRLLHREGGPR